MLKIITKLMRVFNKSKNDEKLDYDELKFLYLTPFQLPKKRWPEFLFKSHNAKVVAAQSVFKNFNHIVFFNANKQLTHFQQGETGKFDAKAIYKLIQIEQREINKLREEFSQFKNSHGPNYLSPFLNSIHTYIQSLEEMLLTKRHHHKTALYLNDYVRGLLQETDSYLTNIFSFVDEMSIKESPKKLEHCQRKLLMASNEINNFPEYQSWYLKLYSTTTLLQSLVHGETNCRYSEIKKSLRPWFAGFAESELFLEQCVRQLLANFMVPKIKTITDKRLQLIREFHPFWAEAINERLEREAVSVHHDNNKIISSINVESQKLKPSFLSRCCFWLNSKKNQNCTFEHTQSLRRDVETRNHHLTNTNYR